MSTIRPLATIGMLVFLGWFLWTRISSPGLEESDEPQLALIEAPSVSGVPPAGASSMPSAMGDTANSPPPAFSPSSVPPPAAPAEKAEGEFAFGPKKKIEPLTDSNRGNVPELPPLPDSIPTADYNTALVPIAPTPVTSAPATTASNAYGKVPALGTEVGVPPAPADAMATAASSQVPPAPAALLPASAAPSATPSTLPMGAGQEFAAAPTPFDTAQKEIDATLQRGELEQAHLLLSQWYGDRSLSADQQQQVDTLLGQLAGSVIYSAEHRLEPPHRVAPGETLESIAQRYQVPWQLLAKINGIGNPNALQPGQELKVMQGPFSAVVDVERQQLALMVSQRYAGRFSVKTEGQAANEGEWVVTQKTLPNAAGSQVKQIVLQPATGTVPGVTLVLSAASDSSVPNGAGAIRVAPRDQDDLFDILSVGSKVIVRK